MFVSWVLNMKSEELYKNLKELAEKLEISVKEQNLRITGLKVKSGLCKVNGKCLFVMDKHKSMHDKIELISTCLRKTSLEDIYIIPAVREVIDKYSE